MNRQSALSVMMTTTCSGPCLFYGGNNPDLAQLIAGETDQINRLPEGWAPMSEDEIRKMMTEG
jgi:hypothetical protein